MLTCVGSVHLCCTHEHMCSLVLHASAVTASATRSPATLHTQSDRMWDREREREREGEGERERTGGIKREKENFFS